MAAIVLALLAPSCYATHEYREIRQAPPHPDPLPEVLPVRVAMVAGALRLAPSTGDALFDLRAHVCRSHFVPRITNGAAGEPAIEVGLKRRPGGLPAVPVEEERSSVELALSARVAADIRLDLGAGRHHADLGGLRIAALHVTCGSGEIDLGFGSALARAPATILIQGGSGRLRIRRLGNASPESLVLRGGSGPVEVDLAGSWTGDGTVEIDARLADLRIEVPGWLGVVVEAEGRDPEDLALPDFRRDTDGRWISPGYTPAGRHVQVRVQPGIGRFEARSSGSASDAAQPSAAALLAPRRSGITPAPK